MIRDLNFACGSSPIYSLESSRGTNVNTKSLLHVERREVSSDAMLTLLGTTAVLVFTQRALVEDTSLASQLCLSTLLTQLATSKKQNVVCVFHSA